MKNYYFAFCLIFLLLGVAVQAELRTSDVLFEVNTPIGKCCVYRPDLEEVQETAALTKSIFIEAFSTTYTEYYRNSGADVSIEEWLRLRKGLTLESWLSATFDEEYEESLLGKKIFVYLRDSEENLIGWMAHTPVSDHGDVYLSQSSLEANSRNMKIATTILAKIIKNGQFKELFPGAKELKLIVRKINKIARNLYDKAGFTKDEKIDPKVYGDSYDERYVGYRLSLENL